jgi:hypothetical protein
MSEKNYFSELAKIDVGNYIEKKGKFSYLSWTYAVDQLRRYDPEAHWTVKKFTSIDGVLLPYMHGPNGAWVEVEVTVKGHTLSQIQPIMDFKNKSVANPDAMDVNKAIQRCLVKGIALHGLGLYIYAGEDLPNDIISGAQVSTIEKKAAEFAELRGGSVEKVIAALGIGSLHHLTSSQADIVIDKVAAWIEKAKNEAAAAAQSSTKEKAAPKTE